MIFIQCYYIVSASPLRGFEENQIDFEEGYCHFIGTKWHHLKRDILQVIFKSDNYQLCYVLNFRYYEHLLNHYK